MSTFNNVVPEDYEDIHIELGYAQQNLDKLCDKDPSIALAYAAERHLIDTDKFASHTVDLLLAEACQTTYDRIKHFKALLLELSPQHYATSFENVVQQLKKDRSEFQRDKIGFYERKLYHFPNSLENEFGVPVPPSLELSDECLERIYSIDEFARKVRTYMEFVFAQNDESREKKVYVEQEAETHAVLPI